METFKKIEVVKEIVKNYYNKHHKYCGIPELDNKDKNHIIKTGTEILSLKWNISKHSGGFVEAFVNNDLTRVIANVDGTNMMALKFFAQMSWNVGAPSELFENSAV